MRGARDQFYGLDPCHTSFLTGYFRDHYILLQDDETRRGFTVLDDPFFAAKFVLNYLVHITLITLSSWNPITESLGEGTTPVHRQPPENDSLYARD